MDEDRPPVQDEVNWAMTPDAELPPEPAPKPRVHAGYWVLGFLSPFLLYGIAAALSNVLPAVAFGLLSWLVMPMFAAFFVLFIIGRQRGNNAMRSYGLGGIWSFGLVMLLLLLAFGACFISLAGFPNG